MTPVFTQMQCDRICARLFRNQRRLHRFRVTGAAGLPQSRYMVDIDTE
jgi:hypothetical protein